MSILPDNLPQNDADIIIIGAGIAGASLGAFLPDKLKTIMLEMENRPGYHSTGRSAAIYTEIYGNSIIRALTSASRPFFESPPEGFADAPLWQDIVTYLIGTKEQERSVCDLYSEVRGNAEDVDHVSGKDYEALLPLAKPGVVRTAVRDGGSKILDVAAIHQGFLKLFENKGGRIETGSQVKGLTLKNGIWAVETSSSRWRAPVIVNATGAWAREIAAIANACHIELTPRRRTVCVVDAPQGAGVENWPMTVDVDEQFYFKPEGNQILISPADETPVEPCDIQPEEFDIAIGIDRVQKILDLEVRHIKSKWAGLRTFAPDKTPVVGFDHLKPGFFWLAGQGGYGIQTSPALGKLAAALITEAPMPEELKKYGISPQLLSPNRFAESSTLSGQSREPA